MFSLNRKTHHTAIIGDLHLSDAEPVHKNKPIWKNFKREEHFLDHSLARFFSFLKEKSQKLPLELVLNGDIFDFDSVMTLPSADTSNNQKFKITKLEKKIGLDSHEHKSAYKMQVIIEQHHVFFDGLQDLIETGNKVIFIIGNHDIELYWPDVQKLITDRICIDPKSRKSLVFCEWFYVSQKDTLIEHGHQYDPYCMCLDPINPIIKRGKKFVIRIPFGDVANRQILNTFGLKNPHNASSFVQPAWDFAKFFFKYELKVQPFLVFNWLIGATRALFITLSDGFLPALKDPLTYHTRIKEIAKKSNVKIEALASLQELHAHPCVHSPITIIRELYLDRFLLLVFMVWGSWQIYTNFYTFANVSLWWFIVPLLISIPFLAYYAQGVKSDVHENSESGQKLIPIAAKIVGVKRVVHGHTHKLVNLLIDDIDFYNPGTWSPNFEDVECTKIIRSEHFVWIELVDNKRVSKLLDWSKIDPGEV